MTIKFTEFELLTLREGLFSFQKYNWDKLTEKEFIKIDNKIKQLVERL